MISSVLITLREATFTVAFLLVIFLVMLFISGSALAESNEQTSEPSARVYTSLADEEQRPLTLEKTSFDCSERIYAVAELANYPKGEHEFSVKWIDPAGTAREHTRYPFHVHNDEIRLWSWLSLKRGRGGSVMQWLDSTAGLEEFIGPWEVQVRIDGKKIAELTMEVNC